MPNRDITQTDVWRVRAYAGLAALIMVGTAPLLVRLAWPAGLVIWLVVCVGGGLLLLVRWHARHSAYRCASCSGEFEITAWTDFASRHRPRAKHLRCPTCGETTWATVLWHAN